MTSRTPQTVTSPFDRIRQVHPDGTEYWSARALAPVLGYEKWERFSDAIDRARLACANSGQNTEDHFPVAGKMVTLGSNAQRNIQDIELTRYACYLTAMNGDPRKPEIASAQMYFATRTREAELQRVRLEQVVRNDPILAQLQMMLQMRNDHLALTEEVRELTARLDHAPISGSQLTTVFHLGQQLGKLMGNYSKGWGLLKTKFNLAGYRDLPGHRYEEAVQFLQFQIQAQLNNSAQQALQPILDLRLVNQDHTAV